MAFTVNHIARDEEDYDGWGLYQNPSEDFSVIPYTDVVITIQDPNPSRTTLNDDKEDALLFVSREEIALQLYWRLLKTPFVSGICGYKSWNQNSITIFVALPFFFQAFFWWFYERKLQKKANQLNLLGRYDQVKVKVTSPSIQDLTSEYIQDATDLISLDSIESQFRVDPLTYEIEENPL